MIRSLQFIDSYFPVIDGVIETVHNYALNMDSAVVCPKMTRDYDSENLPYEVITCPTFRIPHSQYAVDFPSMDPELLKKIEAKSPQILHAHSPALLGKYAISAGHKLGIPVVGSFHSKIYDAVLEFTKSRELAKFVTHNAVEFYQKCDAVWACSEGTAETLRSYGYKGNITVMTNGTAMDYPAEPEKLINLAESTFKLPKDKKILLFVGQIVWYKNLKLILDAFSLLCRESHDYCLVLTGTGKDENDAKKYAESLGIRPDQIVFTGKVADQQLLKGIYLCADLFFFPSVYDNTPLVMREAAAMGIPSLVTEGSNASESVIKDVNGFTASETPEAMCAELKRIFSVPGLLKSAGDEARKTIPIQWASLVPQIQEKYSEIIAAYRR